MSPVSILPGLSAAASHGLSEPSPHWELGDEWASKKTSLSSRAQAPGRSHGRCGVGPSCVAILVSDIECVEPVKAESKLRPAQAAVVTRSSGWEV